MILRARTEGQVIIMELEGHLDFETTAQFKDTCEALMKKSNTQRVIFNMEKLKFVGSSGINQFIRVLKDLNAQKEKPRFCQVSVEFQRVFRAYQTTRNPFQIFENQNEATVSFDAAPIVPPKKAPKKITGQA